MNANESRCFAEVSKGKCILLTCKKCKGYFMCSFYKTEEQAKVDRIKAFKRIASLPLERQEYIAGVYYDGKMPWCEVHKK